MLCSYNFFQMQYIKGFSKISDKIGKEINILLLIKGLILSELTII